jgi:hypothetical protein
MRLLFWNIAWRTLVLVIVFSGQLEVGNVRPFRNIGKTTTNLRRLTVQKGEVHRAISARWIKMQTADAVGESKRTQTNEFIVGRKIKRT